MRSSCKKYFPMTYTPETARLWMAMNIGPLWIGRDEDDPLSPQAIARDEPSAQSPEPPAVVKEPSPLRPSLTEKPVPRHQPQVLVSPESHRPERHELKPLTKPLEAPAGTVEIDPGLAQKVAAADWQQLEAIVAGCVACKALCDKRLSTVFGTWEPTARLAIVGEAPGRDEDLQGKPFVGKSGELLENILKSLGLVRGKDVAIINVLKCRPPNNRDPHENEIAACRPYLERQLQIINPAVVILSGRIASHSLLHTEESMGRLRRKTHSLTINGRSVPTFVTYHPSYLLRSPTEKAAAWHDFMAAKHCLLNI